MQKLILLILTISISLSFYSCEHDAPLVEPKVTDPEVVESIVNDFKYLEDTIFITKGDSASSSIPSFTSESEVTFELTSTPDALGAIIIDTNGQINIDSSIVLGTYNIDINTTNDIGTNLYTNAIIIKVIQEEVFTTYNTNVKPILSQYCFSCHPSYNDYSNMTFLIDNILDRTQREKNSVGFMPKGRTPLSDEEISILEGWKTDGLKE